MKSIFFEKTILRTTMATCMLLQIVGCNNNLEPSDLDVLRPLKETKTITDIENYIDDIKVIEIEHTDKTMIADISKMLITQNGDFILHGFKTPLTYLTKDGKYKSEIAINGRGPKEYYTLYDIALADNNELWLLDN